MLSHLGNFRPSSQPMIFKAANLCATGLGFTVYVYSLPNPTHSVQIVKYLKTNKNLYVPYRD